MDKHEAIVDVISTLRMTVQRLQDEQKNLITELNETKTALANAMNELAKIKAAIVEV